MTKSTEYLKVNSQLENINVLVETSDKYLKKIIQDLNSEYIGNISTNKNNLFFERTIEHHIVNSSL